MVFVVEGAEDEGDGTAFEGLEVLPGEGKGQCEEGRGRGRGAQTGRKRRGE